MPKIVVKVDRKTHTRSHTQDGKKPTGETEDNQAGAQSKSRGVTPKKSSSKQEPRSTITRIQRSSVKLADRKFFTVAEDNTILQYFKDHEATMPSRTIAENLSKKIKHSIESIRDRIKRFLSRLTPLDEKFIEDEAKANPTFYVHFSKENNKKRRTISYINSTLPKVAGSTLRVNERKAIAREHSRLKRLKYSSLKESPREKSPLVQNKQHLSTEELFKLRDQQELALKEKSAQYAVKLRKRNPREYRDDTEFLSPVIKQRDRQREFFRSRAEQARQNKQDLQAKVDEFLEQLRSRKEDDVEVNAHILAEIMRSFSLTFGVDSDRIANLISAEEGGLNVEEIRKKLLTQGQ